MDSPDRLKEGKHPVLDDDLFGAEEPIDRMWVDDFKDITGLRVSNMPGPLDHTATTQGAANGQKMEAVKPEEVPIVEGGMDDSGIDLRSVVVLEKSTDREEVGGITPLSTHTGDHGGHEKKIPEDTTSEQAVCPGTKVDDKSQARNSSPEPGVDYRRLYPFPPANKETRITESSENEVDQPEGFFLLPGVRIISPAGRPSTVADNDKVIASPAPLGAELGEVDNEAEDSEGFFLLPGVRICSRRGSSNNDIAKSDKDVSDFGTPPVSSCDNLVDVSETESEDSGQFHGVKLAYTPARVSQRTKSSEQDEETESLVSQASFDSQPANAFYDGAENILLPYSGNVSEYHEDSSDDSEVPIVPLDEGDFRSSVTSDDESDHSQQSVHGVKLSSTPSITPQVTTADIQENKQEHNSIKAFIKRLNVSPVSASPVQSDSENSITNSSSVDNKAEIPPVVSQDDREGAAVWISIERAEPSETGTGDDYSLKLNSALPIHDNNTFEEPSNSYISPYVRRGSHDISEARSEDSKILERFPEVRYSTDPSKFVHGPSSKFSDGRHVSPLVHNVTGTSRISNVSSEDPTSFNPFASPTLPRQSLTSSDQGRSGIEASRQDKAEGNRAPEGRAALHQQHVPAASSSSYKLEPSATPFIPPDPTPYHQLVHVKYLENIANHFQRHRPQILMANSIDQSTTAAAQDSPLADIFPAVPEGPPPSIVSRRVPRTQQHQRQPSLPTLRESSPRLYEATAPLENENQRGLGGNQQPTHTRNLSGSYMSTEDRSFWSRPPGYTTPPRSPQPIVEEQYGMNSPPRWFDRQGGLFRSYPSRNERHSRESSFGSGISLNSPAGISSTAGRFVEPFESPVVNLQRPVRNRYNTKFGDSNDPPRWNNRFTPYTDSTRNPGYPGNGAGRPNQQNYNSSLSSARDNNSSLPSARDNNSSRPSAGYNSGYDRSHARSGHILSPGNGQMQNSNCRFGGFDEPVVRAEARELPGSYNNRSERSIASQDRLNNSWQQDPANLHSIVREPQGPSYSNRQNHWASTSSGFSGARLFSGPPNDPAIQAVYKRPEFVDPAIVSMGQGSGGGFMNSPRQPVNVSPVSLQHQQHQQHQHPHAQLQRNNFSNNLSFRSPSKETIIPAVPRPANLLPILGPLHRSASRSPTPARKATDSLTPTHTSSRSQYSQHVQQQRQQQQEEPRLPSTVQAPPKSGPPNKPLKLMPLANRPDPKEQEQKREAWAMRALQPQTPPKQELKREEPPLKNNVDEVVILSTWKKVEVRDDGRRKFVGKAVRTEHASNDSSPLVSPEFNSQGSAADAASGSLMQELSPEGRSLPPHLRNKKIKVGNVEQEPPTIRMLGEVPQEVIDSVEVKINETREQRSQQKDSKEGPNKRETAKIEQAKQDKPKSELSKPTKKSEASNRSQVKGQSRMAAATATNPMPIMVTRGTQTDGGAGIPKLKVKELDDSVLESHVIKHIFRNAVEIYKDGDYYNAEVSLHRVVHQFHLQLHPDQHPRGNNNNSGNGNRMSRPQRNDPNRTALLAYFPNRHPPRAPVRDEYVSAAFKLAICQLKLGQLDAARITFGNIHDELATPDGPREQVKETRLLTETSDSRIISAVYRLLAYLYGSRGRDTLHIAKTFAKNAVIMYTTQYGDGTSFWNEADQVKAEDEEWSTVYEPDGVHPFRSEDFNGNIYSEINRPPDKTVKKKRRHDRQGVFKDYNKGRDWEGNWECGNGHSEKRIKHWDCVEELNKSVRLFAAVLESMGKGQVIERLGEAWEAKAYRDMLKEMTGEDVKVEKVGKLKLEDVLCKGDLEL